LKHKYKGEENFVLFFTFASINGSLIVDEINLIFIFASFGSSIYD